MEWRVRIHVYFVEVGVEATAQRRVTAQSHSTKARSHRTPSQHAATVHRVTSHGHSTRIHTNTASGHITRPQHTATARSHSTHGHSTHGHSARAEQRTGAVAIDLLGVLKPPIS